MPILCERDQSCLLSPRYERNWRCLPFKISRRSCKLSGRPTCTLARYVHVSTLSRAYFPNSLQTSSQSPISRRSPSSRRDFPPPYTCLAGLNSHGLTPHWHSRPLPLYMPQLPHSRRTFCHSFPVLGALQSKLSQLHPPMSFPRLIQHKPLLLKAFTCPLSLRQVPPMLVAILAAPPLHPHYPPSTTRQPPSGHAPCLTQCTTCAPLPQMSATQHLNTQDKSNRAPTRRRPAASRRRSAASQAVVEPLYCWTHGPAHTYNNKVYGHASDECRNRAHDHRPDATFNNQMNGAKMPTRFRNRRHTVEPDATCTQKINLSRRQKLILPTNKILISNDYHSSVTPNTINSLQSVSLPPITEPIAPALSPSGYFANADTGATGHYLSIKDISFLRDIKLCTPATQILVQVANGEVSISSHYGYLDIPGAGSMLAYLFPNFAGSLISISQIVNLGLTVTYCGNFVTMIKDNVTIFQGARDTSTGLWMIDLEKFTNKKASHSANLVIRHDSVADMCNFWHATFGYPALSTFIPAVEKGFIQIPGLTAKKLRSHPPNPTETAAGHLDATRQGQRSTKRQPDVGTPAVIPASIPAVQTHCIWHRVQPVNATRTGRNHTDATAAFPVPALSGALYQHIFYSEDADFIHVETTKSRSAQDLLAAAQRAYKFFADRGAAPKIIRMDNECSQLMKDWIGRLVMILELTPVAQHRTNKAERAIRVWKNHFIATLAGIDPECPLSLWEEFIGQAELTLNLMRASPTNPSISAWEQLCGKFDINATPIAPLGTKVMVHDTPEKRCSWQAHGQIGFYVGRALNHYRCLWKNHFIATLAGIDPECPL